MWLYRFWLLCDLFIPFIMIIVGRMTSKHCPKNINSLIGYRTTRSIKIWIHGNLLMNIAENFGGK